MTLSTLVAFAAMAALLIMSPGPNGVLLAKTVPTSGKAAGFANIAGFVVAFFLHGAFAIFGLSVLLLQSANLFTAVKLAGAAYLIWIGVKALRDAWRGLPSALVNVAPARRRRTLLKAFGEGFHLDLRGFGRAGGVGDRGTGGLGRKCGGQGESGRQTTGIWKEH